MLITCCRDITYLHPPRGYTPFRADEMKQVRQQTMETRVTAATTDAGRPYLAKVRTRSLQLVGMGLSDFQALVPYIITMSFIRDLLNPNSVRHLTSEQAPSYTWPTSFISLTEHDLCGPRGNFDPRLGWRSAISTARACPTIVREKYWRGRPAGTQL